MYVGGWRIKNWGDLVDDESAFQFCRFLFIFHSCLTAQSCQLRSNWIFVLFLRLYSFTLQVMEQTALISKDFARSSVNVLICLHARIISILCFGVYDQNCLLFLNKVHNINDLYNIHILDLCYSTFDLDFEYLFFLWCPI